MILIAPCTANTIGKIANGICDDVITTMCCVALGSDTPIVLVPGMHEPMYLNPMVQNNLMKLKSMNVSIIDPVITEHKAKMANSDTILLKNYLSKISKVKTFLLLLDPLLKILIP